MAYYSIHAYDADVWIRAFRGLNQVDASLNSDPSYAVEVENVETKNGVLQPQAGIDVMDGPVKEDCPRVETLAKFHRRWYTGDGSHDWYVCCAGGKFYQKQAGNDEADWHEIPLPQFTDEEQEAFKSSVWSWVTYEIAPEVGENTVDVLIMSNAKDGMIMIEPPDKPTTWGDIKALTDNTWGDLEDGYIWGIPQDETVHGVMSPKWTIDFVDTRTDPTDDEEPQKKFAVIERWNERLWGTGVPDEPDTLYYSKAYAPEDWTTDSEIPENSAGEIRQPTWDGDKFYALKRFGDQLLAFKKNRVWRIMGVSPDQFDLHEQYGRGTEFFNTIAVEGERCFMATRDALEVYDGMNTTPYGKEQIEELWRKANVNAFDQMCAVMFDRRYYLAFPTEGSTVNNAMLVYNLEERTILYYPDLYIEAFLPTDDILYATSSSLPGKILRLNYDSWFTGKTTGKPTKWMTPWMDFGYKTIQKGGYEIYFTPEVKGSPMTFRFSIQTEKKIKTKIVTVQTTTFKAKQKRIRFGGTGRRFRLIIETGSAPADTAWRLLGGIQMVVETDPD